MCVHPAQAGRLPRESSCHTVHCSSAKVGRCHVTSKAKYNYLNSARRYWSSSTRFIFCRRAAAVCTSGRLTAWKSILRTLALTVQGNWITFTSRSTHNQYESPTVTTTRPTSQLKQRMATTVKSALRSWNCWRNKSHCLAPNMARSWCWP